MTSLIRHYDSVRPRRIQVPVLEGGRGQGRRRVPSQRDQRHAHLQNIPERHRGGYMHII